MCDWLARVLTRWGWRPGVAWIGNDSPDLRFTLDSPIAHNTCDQKNPQSFLFAVRWETRKSILDKHIDTRKPPLSASIIIPFGADHPTFHRTTEAPTRSAMVGLPGMYQVVLGSRKMPEL